jgi:O-antigen ligase
MKFAAAASVPAIIGILTVGSVEFDFVHSFITKFSRDPTFTGRNEIWRFALDHIAERPIFGFGYQAFWGTSELLNSWTYLRSWGFRASDAHNGFLNVAVTTGVAGLVLSLIWTFVQPLRDLMRTPPDRVDPALTTLFLQIWLFDLYLSAFESELFNGGSIVWFMTVASILGLRFQATTEHVEGRT